MPWSAESAMRVMWEELDKNTTNGEMMQFFQRHLQAAYDARRNEEAKTAVCEEILSIMRTYDEQMERDGYVDTPGGLEHMGDVWRRLDAWREALLKN